MKPVLINTPPLTLEQVAQILGLTKDDVRETEKNVARVVARMKKDGRVSKGKNSRIAKSA